jgi:hypothetical protein
LNLQTVPDAEPGDWLHRLFGESLARSDTLLMSFSPPALLVPSATLLVGLGLGVSSRAALGGLAFGPFGDHPRQFRLLPALGFRL